MATPNSSADVLRKEPALPRRLDVWGVRNYHTTLERRAISGGTMTGGYISMVLAATVMATPGLLLDSTAAVTGSMCVAPSMAPSRAVCIGALFRNGRVFVGGTIKQFVGLLVIGSVVAAAITIVLMHYFPTIGTTPEILLRAMPTSQDVALSAIIAVSAGAAASLALVAQPHLVESPWGQVIDAVIGVELAISLVPPAAVIGIGWALGTPEHSRNAFYLLLLNLAALDLVGSLTILAIRGVRHRHLELEKRIRQAVAQVLQDVPGFIAVQSTVDITLLKEGRASIDVILRRRFGGSVPDSLAAHIAESVLGGTACQSDVTVEVVPVLTYGGVSLTRPDCSVRHDQL